MCTKACAVHGRCHLHEDSKLKPQDKQQHCTKAAGCKRHVSAIHCNHAQKLASTGAKPSQRICDLPKLGSNLVAWNCVTPWKRGVIHTRVSGTGLAGNLPAVEIISARTSTRLGAWFIVDCGTNANHLVFAHIACRNTKSKRDDKNDKLEKRHYEKEGGNCWMRFGRKEPRMRLLNASASHNHGSGEGGVREFSVCRKSAWSWRRSTQYLYCPTGGYRYEYRTNTGWSIVSMYETKRNVMCVGGGGCVVRTVHIESVADNVCACIPCGLHN